MKPQDLYLRYTDTTGKNKTVITQHRVWDADRFVASQQKAYAELKDPADRRAVSIASRADYLQFRA